MNFSQQPLPAKPLPKITVSLPKHAASKLRDLVLKQDLALLKLGIISVQFEGDQTIALAPATTAPTITSSAVPSPPQNKQSADPIIEPTVEPIELEMFDLLFPEYTLNI